jgi:hypothetical protein
MEEGVTLGSWVMVQRAFRDKGKLDPERIKRLDSIGFSWDPFAEDWENGFCLLLEFKNREGHCRIPLSHIEKDFTLGNWVSKQREFKKNGRLNPDRIHRLESLGFIWDAQIDSWEIGFVTLEQFKRREGHCRVPLKHVEEGITLGRWVMTQRTFRKKGKLDHERIKRLDSVGFNWKLR